MGQNEWHSMDELSAQDYQKILEFMYEIKNNSNKMHNILHGLNKCFGCSCSSFWLVKDDYSMVEPVGANIDRNLLLDYERNLYKYDDFGLQHINPSVLSSANVLDYDRFVLPDKDTPYTSRLKKEKIHHKYSIMLRNNRKICGAIALFQPLDSGKEGTKLSSRCLETVAPFIDQEYTNLKISRKSEQILSILQTELNTSETGVVLFDRDNLDRIIYYNPKCTKYCFDFVGNGHPNTIVSDFIHNVIEPFIRAHSNIKELSVEIPTSKGNIYKIRIMEGAAENNNICTIFISPRNTYDRDDTVQSLFSQLSPREREITLLISQGMTNAKIAERLFISVSTVKSHIKHVFEKANVSNRTSLVATMRPDQQD